MALVAEELPLEEPEVGALEELDQEQLRELQTPVAVVGVDMA